MAKEEDSKTYKSRRYLVDKHFQLRYTILLVIVSAIVYGILGYLLYQEVRANTEILQIQNPELLQNLEAEDFTILYYLAAFFLLQVGSLFVLGILITHRIAGPLHRFQRYLRDLYQW